MEAPIFCAIRTVRTGRRRYDPSGPKLGPDESRARDGAQPELEMSLQGIEMSDEGDVGPSDLTEELEGPVGGTHPVEIDLAWHRIVDARRAAPP